MMKKLLKHLFLSLALCSLSLGAIAQEKTLAYYNSHESEILPDAQAAFRKGDYDRTLELCRWHYIIFGDDSAYALRDRADRCSKLMDEMNQLKDAGQVKEAKQKASALLAINPNDSAAKAILTIEEAVPPVQVKDTVVVTPPIETVETPVETEKTQTELKKEEQTEVTQPMAQEQLPVTQAIEPESETNPAVTSVKPYEPRTRFVIKAGASVLDLKQFTQTIAPGVSIGVYDAGGSRMGAEVGGYLCPGLSSVKASLNGLDASLVIRAAKGIYPKLGVGFFSCKSTAESGSATQGLCAGAGLTFLLGGHFCLEIGAKYYPAVKVSSTETVSTAGTSYEFPSSREILTGGIAPEIRIGWAF